MMKKIGDEKMLFVGLVSLFTSLIWAVLGLNSKVATSYEGTSIFFMGVGLLFVLLGLVNRSK